MIMHSYRKPELFSLYEKQAIVYSLIVLANCDNNVDPSEVEVITNFAEQYNLSTEDIRQATKLDTESVLGMIHFFNKEQMTIFVNLCDKLIGADGVKTDTEIENLYALIARASEWHSKTPDYLGSY